MRQVEEIIALVAEAMARTADHLAAQLEDEKSELTGPQALRNFAAAIRSTNRDFQHDPNETVH